MQIADNSFDVVMVSFALHEFEQDVREKVFKEVKWSRFFDTKTV